MKHGRTGAHGVRQQLTTRWTSVAESDYGAGHPVQLNLRFRKDKDLEDQELDLEEFQRRSILVRNGGKTGYPTGFVNLRRS